MQYVQFTESADYLAALDRFAANENRSRQNAVECIVWKWLVSSPDSLPIFSFPCEQSLEGWVCENIRAAQGLPGPPIPPHDKFNLCPLEAPAEKVRVRVKLERRDKNGTLNTAVRVFASYFSLHPAVVVRQMIRVELLRSPSRLEMPWFPRGQSLPLWVGLHVQEAKARLAAGAPRSAAPVYSPRERLGLSRDGERIISYDRLTAG